MEKDKGDMYFEHGQTTDFMSTTPNSSTTQLKPIRTDLSGTALSMQIAYQNVIKSIAFVYYGSKLPPKDFATICKATFKELYGVEYK